MSLLAGKGLNKDDVNYRQHEQCKTCMHFYSPGSCELVDGVVSADCVCDKWEIKPKATPKDGEFFRSEYNKQVGGA